MADSSKGEMMKTMATQLGLSSDQLAMLESVLGMVDKKGLGEVAKTDVGQIVRWTKCVDISILYFYCSELSEVILLTTKWMP